MPSHSTLHPRPGVGSLGAHVGPLSSRCDAAALGADQAGHLRPRRYYYSLTLPSPYIAPLRLTTLVDLRATVTAGALAPAGPG